MDNLNTHRPAALYEAFELKEAKRIRDRFGFVYTPQTERLVEHGRNRIEYFDGTMLKPKNRQYSNNAKGSQGLANLSEQ